MHLCLLARLGAQSEPSSLAGDESLWGRWETQSVAGDECAERSGGAGEGAGEGESVDMDALLDEVEGIMSEMEGMSVMDADSRLDPTASGKGDS
eukprot:2398762-Pyramimonas_sp.AAC.1